MNILKWIRKPKTCATVPSANKPSQPDGGGKGNAIEPDWRGQWLADASGFHETRRHVGISANGYHAGIEICYRAGMGRLEWSEALDTPETAYALSAVLERKRRSEIPSWNNGRTQAMSSGRFLYTHLNAEVENAFLELHEIVANIENDPARRWPKHFGDFEKACCRLSQSITQLWVLHGQGLGRRVER
jgi:hypothetical protein